MTAREAQSGSNGKPPQDRHVDAPFDVSWVHRIRMTRDTFDPANATLAEVLGESENGPHRAIIVIDDGVSRAWPGLHDQIEQYARAHEGLLHIAREPLIVPGGEIVKNDWSAFHRIVQAIDEAKICRRSYVIVIGGGAVLDAVGFAAATAHRGVRLIRLPSTTLAQGDSGIGVKNGINVRGKKNFLGTFSPPWAVVNDERFLTTLEHRDWRSGFSEAVKVALVRDAAFFDLIEHRVEALARRDESIALPIIRRSAELHLEHIVSGGDPFELTASRPLDFGHWVAHRLEALTDYAVTHGEAVAIGMALDLTYSELAGGLAEATAERVRACLRDLGFELYHDRLADTASLFEGLDEFREHLGGRLTIPLLADIGMQVDAHEIDLDVMRRALDRLAAAHAATSIA